MMFAGMPLIINDKIFYKTVKRRFIEIFTLRPRFRRYKLVPNGKIIEDGKVITIKDKIIMNSVTLEMVKNLQNQSKDKPNE